MVDPGHSYVDAIDFSWEDGYSFGRCADLAAFASVAASNVLKCEITHEIMNFPTAQVILEESELIGQGSTFQVTDMYSVDNQSSSDIIFEGQVIAKGDNYPFEMIVWNKASEAGNFQYPGLKCSGTHSGDSDDVLESLRSDFCDYIIKGDHDAGTAMGDRVYAGDKDLFAAWRNLCLFEGKIFFYKTPIADTSIDIDFTSGDDDTGVSFTQASNIWGFKGGHARQYYNQVNVQGEVGSTMGTADDTTAQGLYGVIPFNHRDASLTTALASTAATNILAVLDNDPLLVEFYYQDANVGFIQPGQYITLSYNLDGVTAVASGTFIVSKIVYDAVSGVGHIWASSELMYNYTILNYASRQLPMENSELIQQNSGNISTNTTDIEAYLAIGSGNAQWKACICEGAVDMSCYINYSEIRNVGATNMNIVYKFPLPVIIGDKNLVINTINLEIDDADAGDYVDDVIILAREDYNTQDTAYSDGTNRTAAGSYSYDLNEITIGGTYESFVVYVKCQNTNASDLDITNVRIEYWYE
jgi:hypothetical protein